jgi:HD superfamily phosphohydrolase
MAKKIKRLHEFRDPLHGFIVVDRQQRKLIDSLPFQRLREIHQLSLSSLIYPGATHKRFEHSIGVMHLAGRIFDVVTAEQNTHPEVEAIIPDRENLKYWRTVLCLAALCHDLGHLPFSHAAEKQILPKGFDHESLTLEMISSDYLKTIWNNDVGIPIDIAHVKKLSVGRKKFKSSEIVFSSWEAILSEIIVGDAFGADRMDYLLRDSYHAGAPYGRFDHNKLIESLRILPRSSHEEESLEPVLGIEEGGIHSAEALLLARYFMYEQVYFHSVRRVYDIHLIEFMKGHYDLEGGYKTTPEFHLGQTDVEVMAAIRKAARDAQHPLHQPARAIAFREHYKCIYKRNPSDDEILKESFRSKKIVPIVDKPLSPAFYLYSALVKVFPEEQIRKDLYIPSSSGSNLFPVQMSDLRIEASTSVSSVLANIPGTITDTLYAHSAFAGKIQAWLVKNREKILTGGTPS